MFRITKPDGESFELGSTIEVLQGFAELGRHATPADDEAFPQLYYVPQLDQDEPVPDDVWTQIRSQARASLRRHAHDDLSEGTKAMLKKLSTA